jgi:hypothetical protein
MPGAKPRLIADADLRLTDLPHSDAPEFSYQEFALTIQGYDEAGEFDVLAELANSALDQWHRNRQVPKTLREQRLCLFFEQRRQRHLGEPMDAEALAYARDLVQGMRLLISRADQSEPERRRSDRDLHQ